VVSGGIVGGAVGVVVRAWEKALTGMRFTEVYILAFLLLLASWLAL
jgi:hypothetical protein